MNATRGHARRGRCRGARPATRPSGAPCFIAVAVVIGLLLLWRAHDGPEAASDVITSPSTPTGAGDGNTTDGSAPVGTDTTLPGATTTAAPVAMTHPPASVPVLVANGFGTKGGAGAVTSKLIPSGYDAERAADRGSDLRQVHGVLPRGVRRRREPSPPRWA